MRLNSRIVSYSILTLGLLFCSIIITGTWRSAIRSKQTIAVTGTAKTVIISDVGVIRGEASQWAGDLETCYFKAKLFREQLVKFLKTKGISEKAVKFFPMKELPAAGDKGDKIVDQRFEIKSANVYLIETIAGEIAQMDGVQMEMPEYYYNRLAEAQANMETEAMRDARNRAEKMAEAADSKLGPMFTAEMGVIQIIPPHALPQSVYGENVVSSIEKEITAVVHATFEID